LLQDKRIAGRIPAIAEGQGSVESSGDVVDDK